MDLLKNESVQPLRNSMLIAPCRESGVPRAVAQRILCAPSLASTPVDRPCPTPQPGDSEAAAVPRMPTLPPPRLRDPEYQTPMRSIASFSSLSYSNNFEESTSHTLDLVTITELYTRDKRSRPPKQILDLVNKCMLFRISAKTEHLSKPDSAFPVFKVNTDQQLLKQHCPEILGIPEEEVNTEMLSLEDDEILEVAYITS
nr:replication factor A protein 1-like [Ipomoea batatas]